MGDAPAAHSLAVEAQIREDVEPALDRVAAEGGVAEEADAVQLPLAGEGLGVDNEPRLALSAEDVAAVEILVRQEVCAAVDGPEDVEGVVEERTLEDPPAELIARGELVGPAVGLVR